MSWAEEDWTVGLSGRVLQKVKELQVHKERLFKENKQKQLQLDNINTSLEKQTVKYEEVRGELQSVHRELQSVQEEAKAAVTGRERLTQELHTRQAQVCSLEGQLDASRTLNNKLTQEIKRLEAELEKLQNSSRLPDTTLFSTPCWNTSSPWEHNASRQEEQDEGQSRAHHTRLRHQLSDMPSASLQQQQRSTPHRHPSNQSNNFSTPSAGFPWERDESGPTSRRRILPSSQAPSPDTNQVLSEQVPYGKEKEHKKEADVSTSEIQNRVILLEKELSEKVGTLKCIQSDMAQTKKELAARELSLQKARDELSMAHTCMAQERDRASTTEQKLKQLQEELKCQRQNTESSRLQHQQRTKDLEKQHQRDLAELQKERQYLEKQHQQEVNKLNQELQQATVLHNALQAQADKLSLQKQVLDKELETVKEKLKWTEEQLKESQKKEAQTQSKLMEAVREAEGVAVSLEQSRKRERALEEEGKRLAEEKADTQRLLKELQEQTCAPAPVPQPTQFYPPGQILPSHSSFSHPPRPPTHSKRPAATQAGTQREDDGDEEMADVALSYPSDREPGEGIDAEQIISAKNPECLPRLQQNRKSNEEIKIGCDITGTEGSRSSHSGIPITTSIGDDGKTNPEDLSPMLSAEKSSSIKSEATVLSEDLKQENVLLRSELRDVREELQKRLEDLEAQRRAESETRTRLKQLSRKNASKAVERDEKEKEWRTQLENEKAETERLRRDIAALESELKRGYEERDKMEKQDEEERNTTKDDRECEMIELNIQLKSQLAQIKAQLALEREERKREEKETKHVINTDSDGNKELSMKVLELMAEVEELKHRRKDDLQKEEKLSVTNSPLTYLTLHNDEFNSNIVGSDNKLLPSPEQHHLFCQSTNQRNILMSTPTADITPDNQNVIDVEHSPQLGHTESRLMTSEPEDVKNNSSEQRRTDLASSDLTKELEHLQREYAKETERADQYQVKLEVLQSQVTRQTQQLTTAFEKQSHNISGLLVELEEKEKAFVSQGEELLRYKKELDALKTQKREQTEMIIKEGEELGQRHVTLAETSELKLEEKHDVSDHTVNSLAGGDFNSERDTSQPKTETRDAETPTHPGRKDESETVCPDMERSNSLNLNKSQSYCDSVCEEGQNESSQNGVTADIFTELSALKQENQLLKQRIQDLTVSDAKVPTLQTDSEAQEDLVKQTQNSANTSPSVLKEQETQSVPNVLINEGQLLQNAKMSEDEVQELEGNQWRTSSGENDLEEVSDVQIDFLQQQVEALQRQVRALSEETQQQTQELTVWRLASQPLSTFDQFSTNTDDPCEALEQIVTITQSLSSKQQTDELTQSQDSITIIREDELSLCCSSNKLQGHMLFSRLENRHFPEPKSLGSREVTAEVQQDVQNNVQNTAAIHQESENKNQFNLKSSDACPDQYKVKRNTDFIHMSLQKMVEHEAKNPHAHSEPNPTNMEESCTGKPEAKPNSSRATDEVNTTSNSADKDVITEIRSVSSQTEESLYRRSALTVCATTQTMEEEDEDEDTKVVDSPPVSSSSEKVETRDKILFSGSFPIPADPARLAERILRNRTQLSAAFDDTEYEPYGLPEVVMKGFADIPTGPSCPYIVRRGLLGTAVLPPSQKDPQLEDETD
ncbi:centromere protein F [Cololabis saira]|uniref:centromere protein F n=1 Tax=Cololabis saira TaxID=129043 RepID=UPI002AD20724|nr:centromere protein F [Cololabis saira]